MPLAGAGALPSAPQLLLEARIGIDVLSFLSLSDIANVSGVSTDVRRIVTSQALWHALYLQRWPAKPPRGRLYSCKQYKERILQPHVNDELQVKWTGSFNLVHEGRQTEYQGASWWKAKIVEKNTELELYRVRYSQWEASEWMEWVPRDRLRWSRQVRTEPGELRVGDPVELTCRSSIGASCTLECSIVAIAPNRMYDVGPVIRGPRERRLVSGSLLARSKASVPQVVLALSPLARPRTFSASLCCIF